MTYTLSDDVRNQNDIEEHVFRAVAGEDFFSRATRIHSELVNLGDAVPEHYASSAELISNALSSHRDTLSEGDNSGLDDMNGISIFLDDVETLKPYFDDERGDLAISCDEDARWSEALEMLEMRSAAAMCRIDKILDEAESLRAYFEKEIRNGAAI